MTADEKIREVLARYDVPYQGNVWQVQGTPVIKHSALELVASRAKVRFAAPTILRAERDEAVMLVTGTLGDVTEWSIGECLVNVNYKVSGKQAAYPYAMSEKRAKDRVILKLVSLHGLAYSEEEADEFKRGGQQRDEAPEPSSSQLMADAMIEALMKRAGPAAIEAFLTHPDVKRDLGLMEMEDHTRVMRAAADRKAVAPAAQAERAAA